MRFNMDRKDGLQRRRAPHTIIRLKVFLKKIEMRKIIKRRRESFARAWVESLPSGDHRSCSSAFLTNFTVQRGWLHTNCAQAFGSRPWLLRVYCARARGLTFSIGLYLPIAKSIPFSISTASALFLCAAACRRNVRVCLYVRELDRRHEID